MSQSDIKVYDLTSVFTSTEDKWNYPRTEVHSKECSTELTFVY